MQWWIIGYLIIGIGLAEGTVWNKRVNNMPRDVPTITAGGYSAVVICWVLYLLIYLGGKVNGRS